MAVRPGGQYHQVGSELCSVLGNLVGEIEKALPWWKVAVQAVSPVDRRLLEPLLTSTTPYLSQLRHAWMAWLGSLQAKQQRRLVRPFRSVWSISTGSRS